MRKYLWVFVALGLAAFAGPSALADTTVSINLGQSNQDLTLYGVTVNSGYGYWLVQQGSCAASGGNTVCNLTGNFTSSTSGLTSGTYDLVTTYTGTGPFPIPEGTDGPTPIMGVSSTAGASTFAFYDFGEDNTTVTLDLTASDGTQYEIPVVGGDNWLNNPAGYYFAAAGSQTCTGLPASVTCDAFNVAAYGNLDGTGATIAGEVTGSISFDLADAVVTPPAPPSGGTVPEPGTIALASLSLGLMFALRKRAAGNRILEIQ